MSWEKILKEAPNKSQILSSMNHSIKKLERELEERDDFSDSLELMFKENFERYKNLGSESDFPEYASEYLLKYYKAQDGVNQMKKEALRSWKYMRAYVHEFFEETEWDKKYGDAFK